jgi:TDG/mug DNA glycosylase family protein
MAETEGQKLRPTSAELLASAGKTIKDVIVPDLKILFCGINPGLYSGYTGHHFARPGNRFWPALFAAGFTDRLLLPREKTELLASGYGITNIVARSTATAAELSAVELASGAKVLVRKVHRYRPRTLAILGVTAYRAAFDRPKAIMGPQAERIGSTMIWVLPNPSGLNAHYAPKQLAEAFRELRTAVVE